MDSTSSSVEGFISLNELYETVDLYCKTNGLNMKDIALLAGISSTTLTKALRTPENTTMNTILAIGEVVGFRVLLGRGNV
ncbi:hypothetical protein [Thalassotalea piscium]|uniref:AraC-like DNA-binding protein n=1 Tax=Thalassotalea piscium TaxID=1230533 RepID=A0A7X0TSY7_9GAMM|nr:hypothetical protein [Thalassotalea piscium]MBB6542535.1 AraC-like DNA-binding protein [Thalassotalea piscium]